MSRRSFPALLTAALLLVAGLPLSAQTTGGEASLASHRSHGPTGVHGHLFAHRPSFRSLVPVSGVPVFGWGFDAHHFFVTQPRQPGLPQRPDFGFDARDALRGFGVVSFLPLVSVVPTVIIVQQPVPLQMPAPFLLEQNLARETVAAGDSADDWPRLRIAPDSFPAESPRLPPLTLLVLPNRTIVAVSLYWLDGETLYYLTSTGRQGSVPFAELDWEMTTRLNAERNVTFHPSSSN